jgi:hypothetical protein
MYRMWRTASSFLVRSASYEEEDTYEEEDA